MKILRIIQISPYFSPRSGGSEWYCHQLSKRLAERGHEVHVLTSRLDKSTAFNEEKDGFHIHRYPCPGILWKCNPMTFIMHELMRFKADIVHAHSYIFLTSNQAALMRKLKGTPFLLHLHGGVDCAPSNDLSTRFRFHVKKRLYDPTLGKWTAQMADAIASVSKRDLELAKEIWGLEEEKLHWVPNAINLEDFYRKQSYKDPLNVVFIGRLEAWKGIRVFLEAAKLVMKERDVDFLVVGDGSLREFIQKNNHFIKVLGQVQHRMIPEILSEASVIVLPSYMEGIPTVCLEAMAAGVPVVASNVGGTPEVVIDGETGYLFPPGDAKLCADKVLKILADEGLRRRMGRSGRRLVDRFYTWQRVVKKVQRVYDYIEERQESYTKKYD